MPITPTDELTAHLSVPIDSIVAAPGRVNLIGEHIDYNDGWVLPMAIDKYVSIAAGKLGSAKSMARVKSLLLDQTFEIDLSEPPEKNPNPNWQDYVKGVIRNFLEKGIEIPSFEAVVHSDVPLGSGLSSSAALEVATATLLEQLTGHSLDLRDKALLCQHAESEFVGVPCGIMDQFSSVFGQQDHFLLIDCRSTEIQQIPFDARGIEILIVNSNVRHQLADGEYAKRRSECDRALEKMAKPSWREVTLPDLEQHSLSEIETKRACHVISEIRRTEDAVAALKQSDFMKLGQLMNESHQSLRDDYEVSCPEVDTLVELAQNIGVEGGVWGSRITGGGFGGCTVTLIDSNRSGEIVERISAGYREKTGISMTSFVSKPAQGAHVVA